MATETNQPIRYCVDCKWMKRETWLERLVSGGDRFAKCLNPHTINDKDKQRVAVIAPSVRADLAYCSTARGDYGSVTTCGPEGRLWEAKERA